MRNVRLSVFKRSGLNRDKLYDQRRQLHRQNPDLRPRFNAPNYSIDTLLQAYIKGEGNGWMTATISGLVSSVFDSWREVSTVYDADVRTLAIFLDGQQIKSSDNVSTPAAFDIALEIGYIQSHISNRKSDLKFSNVKIVKNALNADELTALAAGTSDVSDDHILLWPDFTGLGDSRAALNAAIAQAEPLAEADCTPESWSAFAAAKTSAKTMNAKYATADNLNDTAAALNAAERRLYWRRRCRSTPVCGRLPARKPALWTWIRSRMTPKPPLPQ